MGTEVTLKLDAQPALEAVRAKEAEIKAQKKTVRAMQEASEGLHDLAAVLLQPPGEYRTLCIALARTKLDHASDLLADATGAQRHERAQTDPKHRRD